MLDKTPNALSKQRWGGISYYLIVLANAPHLAALQKHFEFLGTSCFATFEACLFLHMPPRSSHRDVHQSHCYGYMSIMGGRKSTSLEETPCSKRAKTCKSTPLWNTLNQQSRPIVTQGCVCTSICVFAGFHLVTKVSFCKVCELHTCLCSSDHFFWAEHGIIQKGWPKVETAAAAAFDNPE